MKIVYFKKNELVSSDNNIRIHSKEQIKSIKKSIKKFGFLVPVVIDNKNRILTGHGRVQAVDNNFNIPCVLADNLTEAQKDAFMIADNKIYELGETNTDLIDSLSRNNIEIENILKDILFDTSVFEENIDIVVKDYHTLDKESNIENRKCKYCQEDLYCKKCGKQIK